MDKPYNAASLYELSVMALENPGSNAYTLLRGYVSNFIQNKGIFALKEVVGVADKIKKDISDGAITIKEEIITGEMVVRELLGIEEKVN